MPDKGKKKEEPKKKRGISLLDGAALFLAGDMTPEENRRCTASLRQKYHPPHHYPLYNMTNPTLRKRYEARLAAEEAEHKAAKAERKAAREAEKQRSPGGGSDEAGPSSAAPTALFPAPPSEHGSRSGRASEAGSRKSHHSHKTEKAPSEKSKSDKSKSDKGSQAKSVKSAKSGSSKGKGKERAG